MMSAREKREVAGLILAILGLVFVVVEGLVSINEWNSLPIEKLALMTIIGEIAPAVFMLGFGVALFIAGIGVYLASSNDQAWRRFKRAFGL